MTQFKLRHFSRFELTRRSNSTKWLDSRNYALVATTIWL